MRLLSAAVLVSFLVSSAGLWSEPGMESAVVGFRKAEGLSVPALIPGFSEASAARARTLADTGILSHDDGRGRGPGLQMLSQGFPPGEYGEILGSGASWERVWTAWLASPTHRAVLMAPGWTGWGWGRCVLGNTTVWVVRFYRP